MNDVAKMTPEQIYQKYFGRAKDELVEAQPLTSSYECKTLLVYPDGISGERILFSALCVEYKGLCYSTEHYPYYRVCKGFTNIKWSTTQNCSDRTILQMCGLPGGITKYWLDFYKFRVQLSGTSLYVKIIEE